MSPLVSVYITTHNRAERLTLAINSVLDQTYENIEIIVSDDGSTDNTVEVVLDFMSEYSNIKYTRSEISLGANHARNKALEIASGEFITGLDDDDLFLPNRVEYFVRNWDSCYSFVCDNFMDSGPQGVKEHYNDNSKCLISINMILFRNKASNQVFTKTERLKKINGFNESLLRFQDWDCWIRLIAEYGSAIRFNEKSYIMHHDQVDRVSHNIESNEAYKFLVKENIDIFDSIHKNFAAKYILKTMPIKWSDCFNCTSLREFKKVLRVTLRIE